jgi:sortase A
VDRPYPAIDPPQVVPSRARRGRTRSALRWGGSYLVVLGISLLAYVGYQLWGTGIYTARAQSVITADLRTHGFPSRPVPGGAVGFIKIPRIGLDMAFVQGVDAAALAKGPGHYPRSPLPGNGGNVVIAGHRTTHLAPFWSIDALAPGDQIMLQTRRGTFLYRVQWVKVVVPAGLWVTGATDQPTLTLTTCNPRFSQRQRLVVRAVQIYGPVPGGFMDHPQPGSSPISP